MTKNIFLCLGFLLLLAACGGKKTQTESADAADNTAQVTDAENADDGLEGIRIQFCFSGNMIDGTPVEFALQLHAEDICAGYVYFPASGREPNLVAGFIDSYYGDDGGGLEYALNLDEFMPGGNVVANYSVAFSSDPDEGNLVQYLNATCSDAGNEDLVGEISIQGEPRMQMPEWFKKLRQPMAPATEGEVASSYLYDNGIQRVSLETMAEGDGKYYFEMLHEPLNGGAAYSMANEADRLGEITGNVMIYGRVNECNDSLRITFFQQFAAAQMFRTSTQEEYCMFGNHIFLPAK